MEYGCGTCVGACCQNIRLALSAEEADKLWAAGTELSTILPPLDKEELAEEIALSELPTNWAEYIAELSRLALEQTDEELRDYYLKIANYTVNMKPGQGWYALVGRCGLLGADNLCSDYDNRPNICREFSMGEGTCLDLREKAGVVVPVKITSKPQPES